MGPGEFLIGPLLSITTPNKSFSVFHYYLVCLISLLGTGVVRAARAQGFDPDNSSGKKAAVPPKINSSAPWGKNLTSLFLMTQEL